MKSAATAIMPASLRPRVLVVDDEPQFIEMFGDIVGAALPCRLIAARSVEEARQIIGQQKVNLLVTDLNLPDGKGTELLNALKARCPDADAIVVSGQPSLDEALNSIRTGAVDFMSKPLTADSLVERVRTALANQSRRAKDTRRLTRLRSTVRKLNEARKIVGRKVDLLCNDLINAYGDLSRQFDGVRVEDSFRKTISAAADLEQLLCHSMDWMLRQVGYANVAVFLAADDNEYQLGAYMKYTIPSENSMIEAIKAGLLRRVQRDSLIYLGADELKHELSETELEYLWGQEVLAINCTYLGENLAAVILFRDSKTPFSPNDQRSLKVIAPLFATALASMVRSGSADGAAEDGPQTRGDGTTPDGETPDTRDADWWKRGEEPPF